MSTIAVTLIAVAAIFVAIALAFIPLKLVVAFIGRNIAGPIKRFIERQRERRASRREGVDRRL